MKSYLDFNGLSRYDSNIKEYIDNLVETDITPVFDTKVNYTDLATVATSGDYNDLINTPNLKTLPITILTNDTTLDDDIDVGRIKLFFVNNSSTISLTMPGDSSRKYVVVALNVIVAALVSAGKNPQYNLVNGGASLSLTWTNSAEPYLLVGVIRLQ